jgi:hypothetical protein
MTLRSCVHEKEVTGLLARGQYPQACSPELRTHVSSCRSCADLVLVTRAFQTARAQTDPANLPSPGLLWWRAQLRRRNAAVERIGKPILGAQIFALSVGLVFAIGFAATQATHGLHWLSWFDGISFDGLSRPSQLPQTSALHLDAFHPAALLTSGGGLLVLIPILATVLLLGGVAVYFASEKSNENEPR